MTDAMLVRRVLDGDPGAFTTLVDRHAAACLRFATRMLGNREDAEDATQETLLRAYRSLGRYEERDVFRTWLFSILVNRCRTAAAQRSRRERRFVSGDAAIDAATVPAEAEAVEMRAEVARAVAALEPDQREAFLLKHVEQLSYEEMAAVTGAGVSALKMRVKRACERMHVLLTEVSDVRR
ncbi:MAG TPA: RNA polymerase sigma factor [Gemmatimonadaceae bacterium]|nr:RNA polymerase sigma factor [Gemmatimonadaceae bacterium]